MKSLLQLYRLQRLFVPVAVFIFLLPERSFTQSEEKIKVILNVSDIKKIDKADQYIDDGDKLIEAANQLYLETFAVQGNYELSEKAKEKKVKQLEGQARQKIMDAAALYQKGNEIKYGLYKTYIERFWSGYKGNEADYVNAKLIEEQSNDFFYQAITQRNEANKMPDGNEKVEKINKANELESQAIDKQIAALGIYYNIDLKETPAEEISPGELYAEPQQAETTETTALAESTEPYQPVITEQPLPLQTETPYQSTVTEESAAIQPEMPYYTATEKQYDTILSGQVIINRQMIEMYNRYVVSQGRPQDSLSTTGFANMSSFDIERILQLWYAYLDSPPLEGTAEEQPALAEAIPEPEEMTPPVPETTHEQETYIPEPVTREEKIAVIDNERQALQVSDEADIIYRVQIAADKAELSQRALQRIYYGNKSVEMIEEDGWYKYSVGDFASYAEANKFRKSCNVKNAFIVAYRKGQRFLPGITAEADRTTVSVTPAGAANMPAGIVFRVQVAASRAQLTKEQVAKIYPGPYPVEVIEEEGWYKYQFLGVRLYSDALAILKDVPVMHAFVSAYEDGEKTNLYQSVVNNRTLERSVRSYGRKGLRETEYHVQIAASRYPIKQDTFSRLYSGTDPVALIIEDGWYKYRIKAGNSYALAKEIKARCGVDKAFIVAYKRARKIALYEAIRNDNP